MSSGKRFEKTFSRKKKEITNTNTNPNPKSKTKTKTNDNVITSNQQDHEQEEHVTISQLKSSSSSSHSQQQKPDNPKNNDNKTTTQKQKRKAENGEVKKPKTKAAKKKEESSECTFPMNRVMRIAKSDATSHLKITAEAIFLINKASEKFVELFSKDAYDSAVEDRKSFVGYKHLASAVNKEKRLDFLSDFVPEKVTAEKALAERKPAETTLPG